MKKITMMCVQPCIKYYAWQIEVMLNNFKKLKINEHTDIVCLFAYNKTESDWHEKVSLIQEVEEKFQGIAGFFYYKDTREYPIYYISSIRPNILKQHFAQYPELSQNAIFYHDCDIVFTKYPDFLDGLSENDMNWYVSDTISYIGHNYIKSKGDDILDKMCEIVGINPKMLEERELQSGGAQYLMKGLDWQFFEKMEKDSERLFVEISEMNDAKVMQERHTINPDDVHFQPYHPIQIWCADMWALIWGAWMRGYKTNVIPEMDFCWATDDISKWDEKYIYHNAGVTDDRKHELFYKGEFTGSIPYDTDFSKYSPRYASFNYVKEIIETKKTTCL